MRASITVSIKFCRCFLQLLLGSCCQVAQNPILIQYSLPSVSIISFHVYVHILIGCIICIVGEWQNNFTSYE